MLSIQPTGFPKYEVKQDVQTWLESARDDMHGGDSILNKSVTDDKDVSDRRSRSPGMWSDVSVEMTVPHVEIMEKDEDWWRRKGRRRRDVASVTRQNTPASEGRLERPHTAHSIPVGLTTEVSRHVIESIFLIKFYFSFDQLDIWIIKGSIVGRFSSASSYLFF